jgi:hypothetical protein
MTSGEVGDEPLEDVVRGFENAASASGVTTVDPIAGIRSARKSLPRLRR